jgi:hypothetical protein
VAWIKGPRPPRKPWEELSRQFADWEQQQQANAAVGGQTTSG